MGGMLDERRGVKYLVFVDERVSEEACERSGGE